MLKVCRAARAKQPLLARRLARLGAGIAAAAALTAVSACGIFGKPQLPSCPPVAIVADTAKLVKFRPGPGRDLTDVEFEAELSDFRGQCDYDKKGANIDVTVAFTVSRGPAMQGRQAQFDYFVAIPRYRPAEAGKRIFTVAATFDTPAQRGVLTDEVRLQLSIKPEEAESYEIYLGLQLSPDELEFNRRHRAR
jgi:hypothetical protein